MCSGRDSINNLCCQVFYQKPSEENFGSVGFESIFKHLEIICNERPIKVCNDNIDISKSSSLKRTKIFTCEDISQIQLIQMLMQTVVRKNCCCDLKITEHGFTNHYNCSTRQSSVIDDSQFSIVHDTISVTKHI